MDDREPGIEPAGRAFGACSECDLLFRRRPLERGQHAECPRCGATLYSRSRLTTEQMLGLVTGALLTFLIANAYPIVEMQIQGDANSTTLFSSVISLWGEGRRAMAGLVFATTMAFPLLDLGALLALLLAVSRSPRMQDRPAWFAPLLRFVLALRPWGMVEVFMLGILVALVKLSHMATILPGIALWAFGALTVLLAGILAFDLRGLWDSPEL